MGRAHEVRAKAMAATAAARSALFMRASKEIYMAAKSGVPDPDSNLALRSAIEKWKGQHVTKEVIERAIVDVRVIAFFEFENLFDFGVTIDSNSGN